MNTPRTLPPGPWWFAADGPVSYAVGSGDFTLAENLTREAGALISAAPLMLDTLREAELVLAEKLRRLGSDPEKSPTYRRIRETIARAQGVRT